MMPATKGPLTPTPDNPEEFYLLLALVTALFPLQWYLGRQLHKKSTALFAISSAEFHSIRENETDEFRAALKAYKRVDFWTMFPALAVVLAVYFWFTSTWRL